LRGVIRYFATDFLAMLLAALNLAHDSPNCGDLALVATRRKSFIYFIKLNCGFLFTLARSFQLMFNIENDSIRGSAKPQVAHYCLADFA
jgi:hypothetical protein